MSLCSTSYSYWKYMCFQKTCTYAKNSIKQVLVMFFLIKVQMPQRQECLYANAIKEVMWVIMFKDKQNDPKWRRNISIMYSQNCPHEYVEMQPENSAHMLCFQGLKYRPHVTFEHFWFTVEWVRIYSYYFLRMTMTQQVSVFLTLQASPASLQQLHKWLSHKGLH